MEEGRKARSEVHMSIETARVECHPFSESAGPNPKRWSQAAAFQGNIPQALIPVMVATNSRTTQGR